MISQSTRFLLPAGLVALATVPGLPLAAQEGLIPPNHEYRRAQASDDPFGGSSHEADDPFGTQQPRSQNLNQRRDSRGRAQGELLGEGVPQPGNHPGLGAGRFVVPEERLVPQPTKMATPPATVQPVVWADGDASAARTEYQEILNSPLSSSGFNFVETPLEEVLQLLREEYQMEIHLDISALDEIGIGPDQEVSIRVEGISLRAALRLMLRPLELQCIVRDEVLMITTQEVAQGERVVAAYPVGDLLGPSTSLGDLSSLILTTVAADNWSVNGGGAAAIQAHSNGLLVVSQTEDVHCEIHQMLVALRKARQLPQSVPPANAKAGSATRRSPTRSSFGRGGRAAGSLPGSRRGGDF